MFFCCYFVTMYSPTCIKRSLITCKPMGAGTLAIRSYSLKQITLHFIKLYCFMVFYRIVNCSLSWLSNETAASFCYGEKIKNLKIFSIVPYQIGIHLITQRERKSNFKELMSKTNDQFKTLMRGRLVCWSQWLQCIYSVPVQVYMQKFKL